jgi:hypothetical protein
MLSAPIRSMNAAAPRIGYRPETMMWAASPELGRQKTGIAKFDPQKDNLAGSA